MKSKTCLTKEIAELKSYNIINLHELNTLLKLLDDAIKNYNLSIEEHAKNLEYYSLLNKAIQSKKELYKIKYKILTFLN